jgi:hypothetical protein
MSEGDWNIDGRGDASPSVAGRPVPCLGAIYRPAPPAVPQLRAAAGMAAAPFPPECNWLADLDLTGEDGQPDTLGNLLRPVCVPVGAVRMLQVQCGDGRKPSQDMVDGLFRAWDGNEAAGTFTDTAFARLSSKGLEWGPQRLVVPRWTVLEADGVAPDLGAMKQGIWALGGLLGVFNMTAAAMNYDRWDIGGDMNSAGNHLVYIGGYSLSEWLVLSWGKVIPVSYAFLMSRLVHASGFANLAWVRPDGRTPSGLTAAQLLAIGENIDGI